MVKKRKCRYTAEEQAIHDEAVRLRKMTDKQLVSEFRRQTEAEMATRAPNEALVQCKCDGSSKSTPGVQILLQALADGKCKGIKTGYATKIADFAAELGLI